MTAVFTSVFPVTPGYVVKADEVNKNVRALVDRSHNGIVRIRARRECYLIDSAVFHRLMQRLEDYEGDLAKILNNA